jgi:aspartyl-tRNA(Asn)/glutamyl-tRNA(Gln) amidotransferase subunit A
MQKTIQELAPLLKKRSLSPVELVEDCLGQIEKTEPILNTFITVLAEQSLQAAAQAEKEIMQGRYRGVLHGIPYSAKDLYLTKGIRTTAGSEILCEYTPDYNATVIERLNQAGAILVGKNNLHEFAYGTTNENDYFGPCRNPWDVRMIPGGSSGGSAASVSACSSIFSLGTDTGGSIRIPSALCGVTGIKPTYGRVSKRGVIPLSWSQDHAGPLAKSVWDTAAVLAAIAGYDSNDPASAGQEVPDYIEELSGRRLDLKDLTVGICPDYYAGRLHPEIEQIFQQVIGWLETAGARIREISYPSKEVAAISSILTMVEAYAYHKSYLRTSPEKYGSIVRRRLEKGQYIPAYAYVNAQRVRQQDQQEWERIYREIDLLISPTTVVPAFPVGQQMIQFGAELVDPRIHGTLTYMTSPGDFNGYPAVSLPCGFTADRLPVGFQIQGKPFDELRIFQAAYLYEQEHIRNMVHPPVCV